MCRVPRGARGLKQMNARWLFCRMHSLTDEQYFEYLTNPMNPDSTRDMMYCALKAADLSAGNPIDYNEYTVGDWMAEAGDAEVIRIIQVAYESNAPGSESKKKEST